MRAFRMSRVSGALGFILIVGLGVAASAILYAPAWDCPFFADDYQYGSIGSLNPFVHFSSPYADNSFYRPFQFLAMSATQRFWGSHTWPLRTLHYVVHAVLGLLVYMLARRLSGSSLAAALSWSVFTFAQGAAHGIASNDTLTQLLSTTAGFGALFVAVDLVRGSGSTADPTARPLRGLLHGALIGAFVGLCLWSKESGIGLVALVGLLLVWAVWRRRISVARVAPALLVVCAVTVAYIVVRSMASTASIHFGDARHDLAIGLVTVKNVGMMLAAAASPFSTAHAYSAAFGRDLATLGAFALLLLAAGVLAGLGVRALGARSRTAALGLAVAAVVVCFPSALQNRVSELYAYNCLPFIAILVGSGAAWLLLHRDVTWRFVTGLVLVVAVLVSSAFSARSKAALMSESGSKARTVFHALCAFVEGVESGATIGLVNTRDRPSYSVFVMSSFELVGPTAEDEVREATGRADVRLVWLEPQDSQGRAPADLGCTELVACVDGCMVPHQDEVPTGLRGD